MPKDKDRHTDRFLASQPARERERGGGINRKKNQTDREISKFQIDRHFGCNKQPHTFGFSAVNEDIFGTKTVSMAMCSGCGYMGWVVTWNFPPYFLPISCDACLVI